MIIEMLLNNNTQIYFWSNDFTFSKKNVIVYIIEKVLKYILIISIGQNVNKI